MSVPAEYIELRAHSWYSFGAGASSITDMVTAALASGYPALGLTDVSNLCGALEFSEQCLTAGVHPVIGVDLIVREPEGAGPVTLIAETGEGYANLSRLVSLAHMTGGRIDPVLDARFLESHAGGLIALVGAPGSILAEWIQGGRNAEARFLTERYCQRLTRGSVFLELQQHLVYGDITRNKRLRELAERCGVGTVATNEVWYHDPDRSHLHDALTAVRLNASLSDVREQLKVNGQYRLKSPGAMTQLSGPILRRFATPWSSPNGARISVCPPTCRDATPIPTVLSRPVIMPSPGWSGCARSRRPVAMGASTRRSGSGWMRSLT